MKEGSNASWCHHVFLIEKQNINVKLAECEAKFDNEGDRRNCYADMKDRCRTK